MGDTSAKYIHTDDKHNLKAPNIIVPLIIRYLQPASVLDIGCGTGTFLRAFNDAGITDILGIDGTWVKTDDLYINKAYFKIADLEKPLHLNKSFDIAVCLEVAEHLKPTSADIIVDSLVTHSKTVIFSAAVINQGGQNHINEQDFDYWQQKFAAHGYEFYDFFRPLLWNNNEVDWWYRQNMFIVAHTSVTLPLEIAATKVSGMVQTYIHPVLLRSISKRLNKMADMYNQLETGKKPLWYYLKLLKTKLGFTKKA